MFTLRLGDVARVEVANLLRTGRRKRQDRRGKQKKALTHLQSPLRPQ
jgi:hypothetical protein